MSEGGGMIVGNVIFRSPSLMAEIGDTYFEVSVINGSAGMFPNC